MSAAVDKIHLLDAIEKEIILCLQSAGLFVFIITYTTLQYRFCIQCTIFLIRSSTARIG